LRPGDGGVAVGRVGFENLAWVGVPFALAGLATLWLSRRAVVPRAPD